MLALRWRLPRGPSLPTGSPANVAFSGCIARDPAIGAGCSRMVRARVPPARAASFGPAGAQPGLHVHPGLARAGKVSVAAVRRRRPARAGSPAPAGLVRPHPLAVRGRAAAGHRHRAVPARPRLPGGEDAGGGGAHRRLQRSFRGVPRRPATLRSGRFRPRDGRGRPADRARPDRPHRPHPPGGRGPQPARLPVPHPRHRRRDAASPPRGLVHRRGDLRALPGALGPRVRLAQQRQPPDLPVRRRPGPDPLRGGAGPDAARDPVGLDGHHLHHHGRPAVAGTTAPGGLRRPDREATPAHPDREARLAGAAGGRHRPRDQQPHPVHPREHVVPLRGVLRRAGAAGRRELAPPRFAPGAARVRLLPQAGAGPAPGHGRRGRAHRGDRARAPLLRPQRRGAAGRGGRPGRGGPDRGAAPPQPAQARAPGRGDSIRRCRCCAATWPCSSR